MVVLGRRLGKTPLCRTMLIDLTLVRGEHTRFVCNNIGTITNLATYHVCPTMTSFDERAIRLYPICGHRKLFVQKTNSHGVRTDTESNPRSRLNPIVTKPLSKSKGTGGLDKLPPVT